ncbi:MAG: hypothetical protein A2016_05640 [Elusimicrobia bacterium GWF2_62_30]|nr:MAG: hypothetical protein A2016_05640 [Elusimicrobia bacterium GWF2_62_30]
MLKNAALLSLLLAGAAVTAAAQNLPGLEDLPEPTRYLAGYVSGGGGLSLPFGGHWGDTEAGFKPSPVLALSASKRVDELLSWGLETSYAWNYKYRVQSGLDLRMFSLTPFVKATFPEGNLLYYGVLGAGVYQWSQPAFSAGGTRYSSDSGSSLGLNLGGGVSYPFWLGLRAALDLRWHHVFNMKGSNLDMASADNFNIMLVISSGIWKNRAK